VLTSGYNRNNGRNGRRVKSASNEYVFVYGVSEDAPRLDQTLQVHNTFDGIAWNPDGAAFYVSGGEDDDVHVSRKAEDGGANRDGRSGWAIATGLESTCGRWRQGWA